MRVGLCDGCHRERDSLWQYLALLPPGICMHARKNACVCSFSSLFISPLLFLLPAVMPCHVPSRARLRRWSWMRTIRSQKFFWRELCTEVFSY